MHLWGIQLLKTNNFLEKFFFFEKKKYLTILLSLTSVLPTLPLFFQFQRVKYNKDNYEKVFSDKPQEEERIKTSEREPSLSYCVQRWLERTPGTKICQCCQLTVWKFCNFSLPLRFYVKSILAYFRKWKTAILSILEPLNLDFIYKKIFSFENVTNCSKNSNSELLKWS